MACTYFSDCFQLCSVLLQMGYSGNHSRNYATITDTSLATCSLVLWLQIRYDSCRWVGTQHYQLHYSISVITVYINYWLVAYYKLLHYGCEGKCPDLVQSLLDSANSIPAIDNYTLSKLCGHLQSLSNEILFIQCVSIYIIYCIYSPIVFPTDLHDKYFPIFDSPYFITRRAYAVYVATAACALIGMHRQSRLKQRIHFHFG